MSVPQSQATQKTSQDRGLRRDQLSRLSSIRITYPRWQRIVDEIGRCHEMYGLAAEPQCLLLVGPTGAGKSTLAASYAQHFPPLVSETGIGRPVVRATIPAPATIKSLATTLLAALGDPRAAYGTVGSMTYRLIHFFRDCGVELLILDEVQHFRDRDNHKVLENASNWLKTLIKETGVSCVLVGLQGEAEEVVRLNRQLARLFGDPQVLLPFAWDEGDPETVQEFRTFLGLLEGVLPLAEPSGLAEYATARRLYVASEGIVAYLMELVRRATYLAVTQGQEHLDDALLATAFDQRLAGGRRGIANPFADGSPAPMPVS
jgi:energy-coupling factor transporter ATP-binding protein EcfA2